MSWLESGALIALTAVLVPVILHFLGRPTPVEVPFPAIQFLLSRKVAAARIYTLREIIILLLRMAVITVAVLVIAGPKVYRALPTCTEKDVIARDIVFFLDNSPTSSYEPPEVASAKARAFDLYRDLALKIVSRVGEEFSISIIPVDHYHAAQISRSHYHDQARAVLRVAEPGQLSDVETPFQIAYRAALALELTRPAFVALSMAKLPEVDETRLLFLQPKPLSRMSPLRNYAITGGEFFLGGSPFSRNGVAMDVLIPPDSGGARLTLFVDSSPQDAADCPPTAGAAETRRVDLSFTLPEARDARLEVQLDPADALPGDNSYRAVVNVPPWPVVAGRGVTPGGVLDIALESLRAAAGGHQDTGLRVHVVMPVDGTLPELSDIADEVSRGAGAVFFLPGRAMETAGVEGFLPADPAATRPAAPVQQGVTFDLTLDDALAGALSEAGIISGDHRTFSAALSGCRLYPLVSRPGASPLLTVEGEPVVLERSWGRGRVVVVGMDPEGHDSPFRRAPGTLLPFLAETVFRTVNWRPKVLVGNVGKEVSIDAGGRVRQRRAELLPPGENTWHPLYVARPIATMELGFIPYSVGWWQARLEEPGAGFKTWTMGINPTRTPEVIPPGKLISPGEALDRLSEAETSDLSGPLAVLMLLLALVEAAAGNHLFRRIARE